MNFYFHLVLVLQLVIYNTDFNKILQMGATDNFSNDAFESWVLENMLEKCKMKN